MNRTDYTEQIKKLNEVQLKELVFAYGLPTAYQSPKTSLMEQAIDLYQYAEQQNGLTKLQQCLDEVRKKIPSVSARQAVPVEKPPTAILKIEQIELAANKYRIQLSVTGIEVTQEPEPIELDYQLSANDSHDIRWYLEDYLEFPHDPNPDIAAGIEKRLLEIGKELFAAVFKDPASLVFWGRVQDHLRDLRIEVKTSIAGATAIPWELLCDATTDTPLALEAQEFVRCHRNAKRNHVKAQSDEKIRILLVICRPKEDRDVPFRSIASQLVRGLNETARQQVQLDVLRPPTFERLQRVLSDAKDRGKPYHVLHFDGHGTYADAESIENMQTQLSANQFKAKLEGKHGYILFENPTSEHNSEFIDGKSLGQLLVTNRVPVLVLNACRSAHADNDSPEVEKPQGDNQMSLGDGSSPDQAFGSFAQEVMHTGVAGVVAMRYNLWVVTATEFVFELYRKLTQGVSLGAAVSQGRKALHARPARRLAFKDIDLQDWSVPVVFEAMPLHLFPQQQQTGWDLDLTGFENLSGLPKPPDIGFIGRDETLLALDRAFDNQRIVLLHAYAGSGKTATAAEFARWYAQTGGLGEQAIILFSTFEQKKTLFNVLSDFGQVFGGVLQANGIEWGAMAEVAQRRQLALQVLQQIPVLWLWDNIEPIHGFPSGTESVWSTAEQSELRDFLRDLAQTQARCLLTSRREEHDWLGDLPRRIAVPPMPMRERAMFAEALADKQGKRLALADWQPLLRFSQGNPLTLTVLIKQALQQGLHDKHGIGEFVRALRAGEQQISDANSEKRDTSLAASLNYGFAQAFSEEEQRVLALLVFFQGFANVGVLQLMGNEKRKEHLPSLSHWSKEALNQLLSRSAELGLLSNLGSGYYHIHPALPWFFHSLFARHWATEQTQASQAFVAAMGALGNFYHNQYDDGQRQVIALLAQEEANLRHAWRLARQQGLWHLIIGNMQGLDTLYDHTGRRGEWAALVAAVTPELVAADDSPVVGREAQWSLITQYRVRLTREQRDWTQALRLQQRCVEWERQQAAALLHKLDIAAAQLTQNERNTVRTLAVSLGELGQVQREQALPDCVAVYEEALALLEKIGDSGGAAVAAFNLGHVYKNLPSLRNLPQAAHWYQRSLEMYSENQKQDRAQCLAQLGAVAWERVQEAVPTQDRDTANQQVRQALDYYHQALDLLPHDAVNDLAVAHHQLGMIYKNIGQMEQAEQHYQQSIDLQEQAGNFYGAATTRFNLANMILQAQRPDRALAYAQAALQGYQRYGERAQADIDDTQRLIEEIRGEV